MGSLLAELIATLAEGRSCTWCAVIGTRGSTPQKAGAAMLVFPDGSQLGTLGGGCVEAEVKRRALGVLLAGDACAKVQTFHLDDDYGWDDGLICGGQMTISVHPLVCGVSSHAVDYYRRLHAFTSEGGGFTEAVVVADTGPLVAGDRYLFDAEGTIAACLAEHPSPEALLPDLPPLTTRPRPEVRHGIAWLPAPARITLLLVGGGHVSQAVAPLAAAADFAVHVLDDRDLFANQQRFPCAARVILGDIGRSLAELVPALTPATYALVMTRGHNHDEEALGHLAGSACSYVGMIGSKRKVRLIFEDLISRGTPPADLARVRAPIGLDIGSQSVPEIAVSIVAELIAFRNLGPDAAVLRAAEEPRQRRSP